MKIRTLFPHADPAVQPSAHYALRCVYLPSLDHVQHSIQDADTSLLLGRTNENVSAAMGHHRAGAMRLRLLRFALGGEG